jgi:hypothetical protein
MKHLEIRVMAGKIEYQDFVVVFTLYTHHKHTHSSGGCFHPLAMDRPNSFHPTSWPGVFEKAHIHLKVKTSLKKL